MCLLSPSLPVISKDGLHCILKEPKTDLSKFQELLVIHNGLSTRNISPHGKESDRWCLKHGGHDVLQALQSLLLHMVRKSIAFEFRFCYSEATVTRARIWPPSIQVMLPHYGQASC